MVIEHFDHYPIVHAFSYGSAFFSGQEKPSPSSSSAKGRPLQDYIFIVDDTRAFHEANTKKYPSHYSVLGRLPSSVLSCINDRWPAGLYFNPYVAINDQLVTQATYFSVYCAMPCLL